MSVKNNLLSGWIKPDRMSLAGVPCVNFPWLARARETYDESPLGLWAIAAVAWEEVVHVLDTAYGRVAKTWVATGLSVSLLACGATSKMQMAASAPPPPPGAEQLASAPGAPKQMADPGLRMADASSSGSKPAPPGEAPRVESDKLASDAISVKKVLIYTATLQMAVFDVEKALARVESLAKDLGGFLALRSDKQITIRVPSSRFEDAISGLAVHGDILHRDVKVEDVTEQYLDISLRLRNARQVRERIAQLLSSAKSVEDSLKIERELERLSAEIERLEGRLKYLQDQAKFSTITVVFQPLRESEMKRERVFQLPFPWLSQLGLGRLLNLD